MQLRPMLTPLLVADRLLAAAGFRSAGVADPMPGRSGRAGGCSGCRRGRGRAGAAFPPHLRPAWSLVVLGSTPDPPGLLPSCAGLSRSVRLASGLRRRPSAAAALPVPTARFPTDEALSALLGGAASRCCRRSIDGPGRRPLSCRPAGPGRAAMAAGTRRPAVGGLGEQAPGRPLISALPAPTLVHLWSPSISAGRLSSARCPRRRRATRVGAMPHPTRWARPRHRRRAGTGTPCGRAAARRAWIAARHSPHPPAPAAPAARGGGWGGVAGDRADPAARARRAAARRPRWSSPWSPGSAPVSPAGAVLLALPPPR